MTLETTHTGRLKRIIKPVLRYTGLLAFGSWMINKTKRVAVFFRALDFYFYNSFLTRFPSYRLRKFYLQKVIGISVGKHTSIHMGCFITGNKIRIGNNTVVARRCFLDGRGAQLIIKDNVSIAPEVQFITMSHQVNSPGFDTLARDIIVEDRAWIATRAIVLPGVTIGQGGVLGAGAVATRDIPAFSVFAGNPARQIGTRTKDLNYTLRYFPFFNTDIC